MEREEEGKGSEQKEGPSSAVRSMVLFVIADADNITQKKNILYNGILILYKRRNQAHDSIVNEYKIKLKIHIHSPPVINGAESALCCFNTIYTVHSDRRVNESTDNPS